MRSFIVSALFFFAISLSTAALAEDKPTQIYVGITPWQKGLAVDDINRLYLPMLKYLDENTGVRFVVKPMKSYEETIEKISSGEVQLAMLSPEPYVKAKKSNPDLDILVTEKSWNQEKTAKTDSYRSFILVRKDRSDLRNLASLKGKSLGLVAESSTSGYVVPMALFREKKIDPKSYFSKVSLLGSHSAVTDALAAGTIDAGATWDFNWGQAKAKHGDAFKAIWTSDAIPNLCIVAHPGISSGLRAQIRKLLLKIPPELLKGLPAAEYVHREDSFYDSVRRLSN